MAKNLRQFTYTGRNTANSKQASMTDAKTELLTSMREDISALLRSELKDVLASEFEAVKSEIQSVKTEVVNSISLLRSDLDSVKTTVADMEHSLTTCSDDVACLQTTVNKLQAEVSDLQNKCLDMEGRMRRSNIRILNVPEGAGSGSPPFVTKLLKEVFGMDKDVMVDRSHRTPQLEKAKGKPRAIIAKLHYHQDCVEILRRARQAGGALKYGELSISIFPDYPPAVARARSAFNEVKQLLKDRSDVRYGVIHLVKFRITHNGNRKDFLDPKQALLYVQSNIVDGGRPTSNDD